MRGCFEMNGLGMGAANGLLQLQGADCVLSGSLSPFQGADAQVDGGQKRRNDVGMRLLLCFVRRMTSPLKRKWTSGTVQISPSKRVLQIKTPVTRFREVHSALCRMVTAFEEVLCSRNHEYNRSDTNAIPPSLSCFHLARYPFERRWHSARGQMYPFERRYPISGYADIILRAENHEYQQFPRRKWREPCRDTRDRSEARPVQGPDGPSAGRARGLCGHTRHRPERIG